MTMITFTTTFSNSSISKSRSYFKINTFFF
nr:MAG TPA: hypothetical protein [Bacteriophage sp.]